MFGLLKKANRKVCGPSFKESHERVLDFSGNKLIMTLPGEEVCTSTDWAGEEYRQSHNLYDASKFHSAFGEDQHLAEVVKDVPGFCALEYSFSFSKGHLIKSYDFSLGFNVLICTHPHRGNIFNATVFEEVVLEHIAVEHGPYSSLGNNGRRFKAPLDWRVLAAGGNQWVIAGIEQIPEGSKYRTNCYAPITGEHFVVLQFVNTSYYQHGRAESDASKRFIDDFISRVQIKRSSAVQAQKKQAEFDVRDARVSPFRGPFLWLEYDEYPEKFFSVQEKRMVRLETAMIEENLASGRPKYMGLERPCLLERLEKQRKSARKIREELERQGKPIT